MLSLSFFENSRSFDRPNNKETEARQQRGDGIVWVAFFKSAGLVWLADLGTAFYISLYCSRAWHDLNFYEKGNLIVT